MNLTQKIISLFESNISSYRISKNTGISISSVVGIRNGDRDVDNLHLNTAEKLGGFWDMNVKTVTSDEAAGQLDAIFDKLKVKAPVEAQEEVVGEDGEGNEETDELVYLEIPTNEDAYISFAIHSFQKGETTMHDVLTGLAGALGSFDDYYGEDDVDEDAIGYYPPYQEPKGQYDDPDFIECQYTNLSKSEVDYFDKLGDKLQDLANNLGD